MSGEGPSASLRIERVSKRFGDLPAVNDFSLEVAAGEFVSLLGPSGCGKTTLLRMIGGFEFPDDGRIVLDDVDITDLSPNKRPTNMVFQRVTLFPHLDVAENVGFGLRIAKVGKAETDRRVTEALELVRLPGFERREVHTLSGGQAQRVALARAIVNQPRVLLFDEPLSALDLQIRRELQIELKDIHRELGGTFVYVTHDQEEAMSMSDRVVVMRLGAIEQTGTPVELYRQPVSLFVASFVGSSNVIPITVKAIRDGAAVVELAGIELEVGPASEVRPGEDASLVLRAEAISLEPVDRGASGLEGVTSMRGRVADMRFVGAMVHYRVETAGVRLHVIESSEGSLLEEGTDVNVSWRPDDALVLPEGAAEVAPAAEDGGRQT
ncbi:MAG TPA: ABC transporter ATP-binding protein [Actinomycetota bacterium]|nr:ABC transporter ATP-binding protein [Actinomycetota bacterium]